MKNNRINQVEPLILEDDIKSVVKYLDSGGWITENKISFEFENNISNYVNRKFGILVPNGTIALYLALLSLGVGPGKKVAVPNITMIATINSIIWTGASPVIVDIDESLCISLEKLKTLKNIHTVIFVPLNGRVGNGKEVEKYCKENNIFLLEDSAHALGSEYEHKKCGSLGDLSTFSFTPHKIITTGQGGMILTDKTKYKKIIDELKYFNRLKDKSDWHKGFGLNFKFTDLQAALGISQFNKLERFIKNKKNNEILYEQLINNKNLVFGKFKINEIPWFFDVKFSNVKLKNIAIKKLLDSNIETREVYPPLSMQKYLKNVEKTNTTYSEKISKKLLWLPSSNNLNKNQIKRISNILNNL